MDYVLEFAIACLEDENGISEKAYTKLYDLYLRLDPIRKDSWKKILDKVDATNGMFYLPEDWKGEVK